MIYYFGGVLSKGTKYYSSIPVYLINKNVLLCAIYIGMYTCNLSRHEYMTETPKE